MYTPFQPISLQSLKKSFENKPTTPWPTTKVQDIKNQPNLAPAKEQFETEVIQGWARSFFSEFENM